MAELAPGVHSIGQNQGGHVHTSLPEDGHGLVRHADPVTSQGDARLLELVKPPRNRER